MSDGGGAEGDLFRLWLEGARAFADAGPAAGAAWPRAEAMHKAWTRFAEAFAAAHADRAAGPGASPLDPAGWLRPEGQGGMADLWRWFEGPELADILREERTAIRATREWIAFSAALEQFRAVVAEGWMRAFKGFVERLSADLAAAREAKRPDPDWHAMTALWREVADAEMARTHRSAAFLAAQRDLIEAQIAVRQTLRARIDRLAGFLGLPTRAELDDLHETVHALRRELRALRRGAGSGPDRGPEGDP
ncbi:MAG: poly(R)-hydroxyalkanoic acid synthase subunit PhaE [Thermohalobaculum sp.]|nr:poly(R)-hydroxyalkanoic acid synthase subunit PhaE [Thermohalobaculum sp.]